MPGEDINNATPRVKWLILSNKIVSIAGNNNINHSTSLMGDNLIPSYRGTLYITNYRIVLQISRSRTFKSINNNSNLSKYDLPSYFDVLSIPLCSITRVTLIQPKNALHILTKDYRNIKVFLSLNDQLNNSKALGLIQMIEGIAFNLNKKLIASVSNGMVSGSGISPVVSETVDTKLFNDVMNESNECENSNSDTASGVIHSNDDLKQPKPVKGSSSKLGLYHAAISNGLVISEVTAK